MDKIDDIFKKTKEVKLEKNKKDSIRGSVLLFMEKNPLNKSQPKTGLWASIFSSNFRVALVGLGSLALVVFIAGSLSVQAQSALPGDALYPLKVGFNEKVLKVLAFSDQAKTKLNIQLADQRLQEAEKLAIDGKITNNQQDQISNNFKSEADQVVNEINNLNRAKKYNDAQKVASDFEASLKTHTQVLQSIKNLPVLAANNNQAQENINSLINKVSGLALKTSDTSIIFAKNIDKSPSVNIDQVLENKKQNAQKAIFDVENIIESQKNAIGADVYAQTQNNLTLANQMMSQGIDELAKNPKGYNEANVLFDQANIIAKESKNLINIRKNLGVKIDIRINQDAQPQSQDQKTDNQERPRYKHKKNNNK